MTTPSATPSRATIDAALKRIAPLFPLNRFVAVNPFLGFVDVPFADACALLQRTTGAAPLLESAVYRELLPKGERAAADPAGMTAEVHSHGTMEPRLNHQTMIPAPGTFSEYLDRQEGRSHWAPFITDELSKWCGTYFDRNQTMWCSPWREAGLYCAWREAARLDRNPEVFGLGGFRASVSSLAPDPDTAILAMATALIPPAVDAVEGLQAVLARMSGWAGYARHLDWESERRGGAATLLRDLLAIRLGYEWALWVSPATSPEHKAAYRKQAGHTRQEPLTSRIAAQNAYELTYQSQLAQRLVTQPFPPQKALRPEIQAAFCIDVRSEVLRRHLEAVAPDVETIGFAGFFGFALAHRDGGEDRPSARCPALLIPSLPSEPCAQREPDTAELRAGAAAWKAFQISAASCFSFVETAGLAFAGALFRQRSSVPACRPSSPPPRLNSSVSLEARITQAAGALRGMGLQQRCARLVLLCGHGASAANNPHAHALACGACGGHAGDVNARIAADTLNDPAVRAGLRRLGIHLPEDTWFIAGLHNTTTDDVCLFEDQVPPHHRAGVSRLKEAFARAGRLSRRERSRSLGLSGLDDSALHRAMQRRGSSISQTRPEWGLANNASMLVAPRARSQGLDLGGRVFLHDYASDDDPGGSLLALILRAPVVVASWINLQYYAARVQPGHHGAGDKVFHNVVGGIGVLDGNGGDLRSGLPLQCVHDGYNFVHEPRRLSVYVEAPREKIGLVLKEEPSPRALFDNGWIHLFALEENHCYRYLPGGHWENFSFTSAPAQTPVASPPSGPVEHAAPLEPVAR